MWKFLLLLRTIRLVSASSYDYWDSQLEKCFIKISKNNYEAWFHIRFMYGLVSYLNNIVPYDHLHSTNMYALSMEYKRKEYLPNAEHHTWCLDCLNSNYIASSPSMDAVTKKNLKYLSNNNWVLLSKSRLAIEATKCLHSLYINNTDKQKYELNNKFNNFFYKITEQIYQSMANGNAEIINLQIVLTKFVASFNNRVKPLNCVMENKNDNILHLVQMAGDYTRMLMIRDAIDVNSNVLWKLQDVATDSFNKTTSLYDLAKNCRLAIVKYGNQEDPNSAWELRFSKKVFRRIMDIVELVSSNESIEGNVDSDDSVYLKLWGKNFYAEDDKKDVIEVANPQLGIFGGVIGYIRETLYKYNGKKDIFNVVGLKPNELVKILKDYNKKTAFDVIKTLLNCPESEARRAMNVYYQDMDKLNKSGATSNDSSNQACQCGDCFYISLDRLTKTIEIIKKWREIFKAKSEYSGNKTNLLFDFMLYECMSAGVPIIKKYKEALKHSADYKELRDSLFVLIFK